jgi:hypothetical protein
VTCDSRGRVRWTEELKETARRSVRTGKTAAQVAAALGVREASVAEYAEAAGRHYPGGQPGRRRAAVGLGGAARTPSASGSCARSCDGAAVALPARRPATPTTHTWARRRHMASDVHHEELMQQDYSSFLARKRIRVPSVRHRHK